MNLRNKKIIGFLLLTILFSGILFLAPSLKEVKAQLSNQEGFKGDAPITKLFDPEGDQDVRDIVVIYIKYFLTFLGLIFTILVIWSGSRWMMSNGNEEEVKKAKSNLVASIIGMIIILSAYALTVFIYNITIDALDDDLSMIQQIIFS